MQHIKREWAEQSTMYVQTDCKWNPGGCLYTSGTIYGIGKEVAKIFTLVRGVQQDTVQRINFNYLRSVKKKN